MSDDVGSRRTPARTDFDDDLAALLGIPDDPDRTARKRMLAIGAVAGIVVLIITWAALSAGGDGSDATAPIGGDDAGDEAAVLGASETTSTVAAPPPSTPVSTLAPPTTTARVVAVSDVTGRPAADARFALELAGLEVVVSVVDDPSAEPGAVVAQDPPEGAVTAGATVYLTVASEPEADCNDVAGPIPTTTFVDVSLSGGPTDTIAVGWAQHTGIISGVGSDVFGVDVALSRGAFVTMLHRYFCLPTPAGPASFTDVAPGDYYADAAAWATGEGIVSGSGDGSFDPDGTTTRSQWVTVVWRALDEPEGEADLVFDDVPAGAFYEPALQWAVANNLVAGTSPTTFSPQAPLTRLDAAALLYLLESTIDPPVT